MNDLLRKASVRAGTVVQDTSCKSDRRAVVEADLFQGLQVLAGRFNVSLPRPNHQNTEKCHVI